MRFPADDRLLSWDVYPKVFVQGKKTRVHIRSLKTRDAFEPGQEYTVAVCAMDGGSPWAYPKTADFRTLQVRTDVEGAFSFEYVFPSEQEYRIRVMNSEGRILEQFPVYCVGPDLAGRYPLMGDLHLHTTRSDGHEEPEVVCANYRGDGYDFLAITDHERYYPSLEAMAFYRDVPTELVIVPGEEVHPQKVDGMCDEVHIVHFGGNYSVNALVEGTATREKGTDWTWRSLSSDCPEVMSKEAYDRMMRARMSQQEIPEGLDPYPVAGCRWVFEEIRKAGGLGIFAHPNWISDVFHVPEKVTDYIMASGMFDAFEVLGGENYFEQNGFQTARYYEERAKGRRFPVVGSTDSHSSLPGNPNARICSTIVFSEKNERGALVESVRGGWSVAVDTISREFRLVGESRLVRYGTFLLRQFFPMHDALCFEEGRAMKQYACGTSGEKEEALRVLAAMYGRVARQREKYFDFGKGEA